MTPANIVMTIILGITLTCCYYAYRVKVPTQVSFPRAQRKFVELLAADQASKEGRRTYTIVDLGSGGGQLCRRVARALPMAQVVGLELSPFPWLRSVLTRFALGPANLTFMRRNFWEYECGDADAVILFLHKRIMNRMGRKLHQELKAGTLIIVNEDRLEDGWNPVEILDNTILGVFSSKIYVYRQL